MSDRRKTYRRKLRGGVVGAVRPMITAVRRLPQAHFRPLSSLHPSLTRIMNPAGKQFSSSAVSFAPPFAQEALTVMKPSIVGIGNKGKEQRAEAKKIKSEQTNGKISVLYSAKTFPIKDKYTQHDILNIAPRSLLGCFVKVFGESAVFPSFKTEEEAYQNFFVALKNAGKLEENGDGVDPKLIGEKVDTSPEATVVEGLIVSNTVAPSNSVVKQTIIETAKLIPEQIYPPALVQQVAIFCKSYPPLNQIAGIFLQPQNIVTAPIYLGFIPDAELFQSVNKEIYRVFCAGFASGFDAEKFQRVFTPDRIFKLKTGLINIYALGNKSIAFQNLDKVLICVKYDVFTPMTLDSYLSTLNTNPPAALGELNKLYEDARKFESTLGKLPILEKIKSKTWHWHKYTTQGQMGGILAVIVFLLAMYGVKSLYDFQRKAEFIGMTQDVEGKTTRIVSSAFTEIKIAGESIQAKAIEPILEAVKPATEPVLKTYNKFTENARRQQHFYHRWWNALAHKFGSKPKEGGFTKTRKLRKM